jgi:hypothetical protein
MTSKNHDLLITATKATIAAVPDVLLRTSDFLRWDEGEARKWRRTGDALEPQDPVPNAPRAARADVQPAASRPGMARGVSLCTRRLTTSTGSPIQGSRKRSKNHHTGLILSHGCVQPPDMCLA